MSRTLPIGARTAQGRSAGLVSRAVAGLIDLLVCVATLLAGYLTVAVTTLVVQPRSFRWPTPGAMGLAVAGALILTCYLASGWSTTGRTVGAQVIGLRVVRDDGSPLRAARAFARALICVLFPFGLVWCAVDRNERSVHDVLVRSRVIYDWRRRVMMPARGLRGYGDHGPAVEAGTGGWDPLREDETAGC